MENLDQFFVVRSQFGFAVLASRLPQAMPVIYLCEEDIRQRGDNENDAWRIDLVRIPEFYPDELEQRAYEGDMVLPNTYDFRWEKEWRLKVPREGIVFERVDFVLAPGAENCKRVNERFGQEAYDVADHIKRVSAYRAVHQGRSPPLEEAIGKHFLAQHNRIKEASPQEGRIIMPEIIEAAWDEIRRS